jgi:hypothetical protein
MAGAAVIESCTVFNAPVTSVENNLSGKWIINGNKAEHELFDGVVVAVGIQSCPVCLVMKISRGQRFSLDGKKVT